MAFKNWKVTYTHPARSGEAEQTLDLRGPQQDAEAVTKHVEGVVPGAKVVSVVEAGAASAAPAAE